MEGQGAFYCHQCGQSLPQQARFCSQCGTTVASAASARPAPEPTSQPAQSSGATDTPTVRPQTTPQNTPPVAAKPTTAIPAWVVGIFILAIFFSFSRCSSSQKLTVERYVEAETQKLEQELNTAGNGLAKHIESIHGPTVTYKGGHVTSMTPTTIDGSTNAGKNGQNVSEVRLVITTYWKGWAEANGFTELEMIYDNQARQMKSVKYLRSNALINFATVNWFQVGWVVGSWLAVM